MFCRCLWLNSSLMFWTNWNEQRPSVMRSTLAGQNLRIIISTDILTPSGLTIDHRAEKLYFSDGSLGKIERCDYDGSGRNVSLEIMEIWKRLMDVIYFILLFSFRMYLNNWNNHLHIYLFILFFYILKFTTARDLLWSDDWLERMYFTLLSLSTAYVGSQNSQESDGVSECQTDSSFSLEKTQIWCVAFNLSFLLYWEALKHGSLRSRRDVRHLLIFSRLRSLWRGGWCP